MRSYLSYGIFRSELTILDPNSDGTYRLFLEGRFQSTIRACAMLDLFYSSGNSGSIIITMNDKNGGS